MLSGQVAYGFMTIFNGELASNAYLRFVKGLGTKIPFEFVKEMPKQKSNLKIDIASQIGVELFTYVIIALFPSVYYYFYQVFKNKAESIAAVHKRKGLGDGHVGMVSWLVVAAMAGALNVLLTNPIWVLVTRMQTQAQAERKIIERKKVALMSEAAESGMIGSSALQERLVELDSVKPNSYGTLKAAREVYGEAGIAGFWKGIIPTLIMVCNPSIQFMIYETSLRYLKEKRATNKQGRKIVTALEVFVLGAVAKLGATVTTYPLLVVKSRLQAKQDIGGTSSSRYSGTIDAIIKMIRYEGVFGFYRGMSTKIVQSVFAASVLFMVKEELVKAFASLTQKSRARVPK